MPVQSQLQNCFRSSIRESTLFRLSIISIVYFTSRLLGVGDWVTHSIQSPHNPQHSFQASCYHKPSSSPAAHASSLPRSYNCSTRKPQRQQGLTAWPLQARRRGRWLSRRKDEGQHRRSERRCQRRGRCIRLGGQVRNQRRSCCHSSIRVRILCRLGRVSIRKERVEWGDSQ